MDKSEYWRRVEDLLDQAMQLQPGERPAFLARIEDPAIRQEVESLLAADAGDPEHAIDRQIEDTIGNAAQDLSISGRSIGRYQVVEQIGAGGMGEVYVALDLRLHRRVALKLLPRAFASDAERVRRFEQEARAASALNHPNLLTIYEIAEADGRLYIATEFVTGVPLDRRLQKGPLSVEEALSIAQQVARALSEAHENGIIHRDIKPSNIMVRPDGIVKVLDFGLARIAPRPGAEWTTGQVHTIPGTLVGTPAYMSPEQSRGEEVDARSDLWSLGVVLYEMLAGAAPFGGENTLAVLMSIVQRDPTPLSAVRRDLNPAIEQVLRRLLAKNPAERYPSARALLAAIETLQSALSEPRVRAVTSGGSTEKPLPAESWLAVGSQIGRFSILARIGQGGMGEVFSALDTELGRTVALKVLRTEALETDSSASRTIREARTASALNHPNIVTIYEVIRSGPAVALVMELVPGTSLRGLAGTPLDSVRCVDIARQIAKALEAAHAAGIVHRDIKPENAILRPDGHIKVLDFGLARSLTKDDSRKPGTFAGTLRYLSPEQCTGKAVGPASDVFSFGVVLYELATGRHPFSDSSPFETMRSVVDETPPAPATLNPSLSPALDALIQEMLAKFAAARPTASEVVRRLDAMRGGSTESGRIPARLPSRSLRSVLRWSVAATVLCAVAAGVFWIFRRTEQKIVDFQQLTSLVAENRATAATISGDGRFSAYANRDGVFLRTMKTWETSQIRAPEDFVVDHLAWFPDGTKLALSGFSSVRPHPSIWIVSITGAPPRLIREGASHAIPSPDGTQLAFLGADQSSIWVSGPSGEQPEKILEGPGNDSFLSVFWSASGRSLLFQRRHLSGRDLGAVRIDRFHERSLESIDVRSRKIVFQKKEFWIAAGVMLPDGRMRFLRYDFPGAHYANSLWEVRSDPDSGEFREEPRNIGNPVAARGGLIQGLSSTDDGSTVVVIRTSDEDSVYVADYQTNPPRFSNSARLTLDTRRSFPHAWTADSSMVIFESDRNGTWDIFRQRPGERTPVPIVANPTRAEVLPQLTPDGKSILYATSPTHSTGLLDTVMRVSIEGGTPAAVPTGGSFGEFRCSSKPGGRCVLRKAVGQEFYVYYSLDPVAGIGKELARTRWSTSLLGDWDISPDGLRVAVPNHDLKSARIQTVELNGSTELQDAELALPGLSDLISVVWAAEGSGWFVSFNTTAGKRMLYVYRDGRVHSIGSIQGLAVPAPDGRRVAYMDRVVPADAWMVMLR